MRAAAERWAKLKEKEEGTFGAKVYKVSSNLENAAELAVYVREIAVADILTTLDANCLVKKGSGLLCSLWNQASSCAKKQLPEKGSFCCWLFVKSDKLCLCCFDSVSMFC